MANHIQESPIEPGQLNFDLFKMLLLLAQLRFIMDQILLLFNHQTLFLQVKLERLNHLVTHHWRDGVAQLTQYFHQD